jgi:ATP/maltotriose-dependent transcriptional regulator MalT
MHLIITSRADPPLPLARLRVRGQLTELRAADLRFTLDEATAFFQQIKNLPIPADQIKQLETRTEGWGAGLHLAALSLHGLDRAGIAHSWRPWPGAVCRRPLHGAWPTRSGAGHHRAGQPDARQS